MRITKISSIVIFIQKQSLHSKLPNVPWGPWCAHENKNLKNNLKNIKNIYIYWRNNVTHIFPTLIHMSYPKCRKIPLKIKELGNLEIGFEICKKKGKILTHMDIGSGHSTYDSNYIFCSNGFDMKSSLIPIKITG